MVLMLDAEKGWPLAWAKPLGSAHVSQDVLDGKAGFLV
jgi:hypothetical protein